ncbi:MAG: hypothetical protein M3461_17210 [Pseudomonadota bacterium]|nr:hypothetical protein [Pseudomonadota bacterium]
MNYAILLVSPIVFVRILDQHAYGQYREFVVYALALATVLGCSVKTSILYFIPKDPDNERKIRHPDRPVHLCELGPELGHHLGHPPYRLCQGKLRFRRTVAALRFLLPERGFRRIVLGAYQIPIMSVVRSAAGDVLFPDMVQRGQGSPMAGLSLWNRANVLYCFVVFPFFTVLFFYADTFVTTLFTDQYVAAVPIFRVFLLIMLRQCFEMSTPLWAMNVNGYFITGNLVAILVKVGFIFATFRRPWPPGGTDRVAGLRGGVGGLSGEAYTQRLFHSRAGDVILEQTHGDRAGRSAERAHIADRGIGPYRGRRSSDSVFFTFPGGLFRIRAPLSAR